MADLVLPASLAVWDPLGGTPEPVMTGHDGICAHTMAGTYIGTDSYFHQNGWSGTESHVGVAGSGHAKQWTPWNRQADANLDGNPRWLSIECADGGESFPPLSTASDSSPPLTAAQLERIIQLCVYWCDVRNHRACPTTWRCHHEGIPARFVANSCERGIGTHFHGIAGRGLVSGCPRWSTSTGKICPRMVRHRQVRDIVVPEVARRLNRPAEENDMPLNDADKAWISGQIMRALSWLTTGQGNAFVNVKTAPWTATAPSLTSLAARTVPALIAQVEGDPQVWLVDPTGGTKVKLNGWDAVDVAVFLGASQAGPHKPHKLPANYMNQLAEIA